MPDNTTVRRKGSRSIQTSGAIAESARLIGRAFLWFAAMTAASVLAALTYARFHAGHVELRAIIRWFSKLSTEQWIGLGGGVAVAFIIVAVPCSKIAARPVRGEELSSKLRRNIGRLAVLGVLILYVLGVSGAYHVSLALDQSRDWAIIHAVYSWVYVGFSFGSWVGHHWNQPLAQTLRQFLKFMKL